MIIKIVGNRKDLLGQKELETIQETLNLPIDIFTSARTRENVDELFESLARSFLITA